MRLRASLPTLEVAFAGRRHARAIHIFLAVNGVMGLVGALATAATAGWPLTTSGMISFVVWNLVYLILLFLMRTAAK